MYVENDDNYWNVYSPKCHDNNPVLTPEKAEEMIQLFSDTVVEAVEKNLSAGTLDTPIYCPYHSTALLEARQPPDFDCRVRVAFFALRKLKRKRLLATYEGPFIKLNKSQFI